MEFRIRLRDTLLRLLLMTRPFRALPELHNISSQIPSLLASQLYHNCEPYKDSMYMYLLQRNSACSNL